MATGGMSLSKEFFDVLKAIGESKSKQEEDRIMAKEVQRLKQKLEPVPPGGGQHPLQQSKKRAKEYLVRLLYVEMLGHDASFGYIKAVEMAASASLYHKRTGYLVCAACLPPSHEFRFMLVNQMQRDLQSTNVLECCGGLLACSSLIAADMVPAVATETAKLLSHESATIRKKTIITLHRFHQLADDVVTAEQMQGWLRKTLCDKDPSVMGSSLSVLENMAAIDPQPFKDLVPSLVSILKQVGEHRLPTEYEYHRVPAPWIQIKLVHLLGVLGRADAAASAGMYEMLGTTLRNADVGINAGYAVVYECIRTVVRIYPNAGLLDAAAAAISRFIQSRSHNLKYLGVTGLALIVEQHAQYAAVHQLAVMDCLEDADETLQRKTLDLLYRMTNPVNVEFIAEKLIDFLSHTTDLFLKRVLTTRVCSIAERYAPNNSWYIKTMTQLFSVAGDMVEFRVAQNLMSLLAEGAGDEGGNEEADMLLRQTAVELYVQLLLDKEATLASLPRILLETMAWCLGEYAYLSAVTTLDDVLTRLCNFASKNALPVSTRQVVLQAILKLVAQAGTCPPAAAAVVDAYTRSAHADLQQRCLEFRALLTACPQVLPAVLPVDASAEDVDVDENLSFLDGYVQTALANGARPYQKPEYNDDDDDEDDAAYGGKAPGSGAFNMTPYEKPQQPSQSVMLTTSLGSAAPRTSSQGVSLPPGSAGASPGMTAQAAAPPPPNAGLSLNVRAPSVWGRGGLSQPAPAAAAPAHPSAATPSNAWEQIGSGGASAAPTSSSSLYGGGAAPAPAAPEVKTAAQLEKERMAAAFFGGIVPGAPPPPSPAPAAAPPRAPPAVAAPAPPPAPPPPAPAADIDLLDMSAWDTGGTPAAAPAAAIDTTFDVLSPTPMPAPAAADPEPAVSETLSEDVSAASAPAPPPAPVLDPFAGAGLLDDVNNAPLASLADHSGNKFEYQGSTMGPFQITTAQFGQHWASCSATSPGSVSSTKVTTLDQFMEICRTIGAHPIEAIAATNEGIAAGAVGGGTRFCLVHAKVSPSVGGGSKIDLTVKSTDAALCGSLAMYLQTMLR